MRPDKIYSHTLDAAATHGQIMALGAEYGHTTPANGSNRAIGVLIQPGACVPGEIVDVAEDGIVDVLAGGVIARGDYVAPNAEGKAVAAAEGEVIGYALQVATATDDLIEVRLQPVVLPPPAVGT